MPERRRRGVKGLAIRSLPYEIQVYMNNQVLIPAQLVRSLGIQGASKARITFEYQGQTTTIEARLLRTKYTDSRQFTIPKDIRMKLGLKPGKNIRILEIEGL